MTSEDIQTSKEVISEETQDINTKTNIAAVTQTVPATKWNNLIYLWISLGVIVFDQLTKYLIRSNLEYGEILRITRKLIWITNIKNTGAAFSFSFGSVGLNRIIFISVSILASIMLIYLIRKTSSKMELISYSLILGGAVGNLIDRIVFGGVTDFIWCDFPDFIMRRWPVFNIADSSIVVAITIMIIYTLFFGKQPVEDE